MNPLNSLQSGFASTDNILQATGVRPTSAPVNVVKFFLGAFTYGLSNHAFEVYDNYRAIPARRIVARFENQIARLDPNEIPEDGILFTSSYGVVTITRDLLDGEYRIKASCQGEDMYFPQPISNFTQLINRIRTDMRQHPQLYAEYGVDVCTAPLDLLPDHADRAPDRQSGETPDAEVIQTTTEAQLLRRKLSGHISSRTELVQPTSFPSTPNSSHNTL